jgi:hypothetical protein
LFPLSSDFHNFLDNQTLWFVEIIEKLCKNHLAILEPLMISLIVGNVIDDILEPLMKYYGMCTIMIKELIIRLLVYFGTKKNRQE